HSAYLAAIFERAGHEVFFTHGPMVDADVALLLTSIVDYRNEMEWADSARRRGAKVGLFGAMATHARDLVAEHADFVIEGETEEAAMRLAAGERLSGIVFSRALPELDSLPFPSWRLLVQRRRYTTIGRSALQFTRAAFPILSSRSCPEFCTYCPH